MEADRSEPRLPSTADGSGMSSEDLARWVADSPPKRLSRGGVRWRALYVRALRAIRMTRNEALEEAHDIALAIDSNRGNEKMIAESIRKLKVEVYD